MQLTRRDALAALAGAGVVGGGGVAAVAREGPSEGSDEAATVRTLVAVAEVVYPSALDGVPARWHSDRDQPSDAREGLRSFVETYSLARMTDWPAYREGVAAATGRIRDAATSWHGTRFDWLPVERRDAVLRQMGIDVAEPDPEGIAAERTRFYVVNELLYALYTSPTGGELVGLENPQGHPGGLRSYRRGPGGDGS